MSNRIPTAVRSELCRQRGGVVAKSCSAWSTLPEMCVSRWGEAPAIAALACFKPFN